MLSFFPASTATSLIAWRGVLSAPAFATDFSEGADFGGTYSYIGPGVASLPDVDVDVGPLGAGVYVEPGVAFMSPAMDYAAPASHLVAGLSRKPWKSWRRLAISMWAPLQRALKSASLSLRPSFASPFTFPHLVVHPSFRGCWRTSLPGSRVGRPQTRRHRLSIATTLLLERDGVVGPPREAEYESDVIRQDGSADLGYASANGGACFRRPQP